MLPKHKYLLTYRYSEIIHDLTVEFCALFISKFSRTNDQMIQAARSGKQNIVEAVSDGKTSKKIEIKLLGIAYGSIEELITDFEDFLRQNHLTIWSKADTRISTFRNLGFEATKLENPRKILLPKNSEAAANLLLTLCHQLSFLLDRQIKAAEKKFIEEGGYTENLFKKRLTNRK